VTYSEAIQFLYSLRTFGTKLGLENPRHLAALAGNPQERLRFIHVAGTNGKGSTCAMLESIYREAGLKVGLFTSPHLVAFGERIQVNRELISEEEVARLTATLRQYLQQFPADGHPTFFEVVTVMALIHFAKRGCDLVIWETGLGGRLDATNIVTPLASVITNIQFDHQRWLGNTLGQIASEKAGIIKVGVPVITGEESPEPLTVIQNQAIALNAPLTRVTSRDWRRPPLDSLPLPLLGSHQRANAAVALATVGVLYPQLPISPETIRQGLSHAHWPGRFQVLRPEPGRAIVLDGAHNPAGIETLRDTLNHQFPGQRISLIFGVMNDKAWDRMCRSLAPSTQRILLAPVQSQRTADPESVAAACRDLNQQTQVTVCASLHEALAATAGEPLVVITGSLHFVGEAMELLRLSPSLPLSERGLNEWNAVP
jgi:dihydrofolate synthase/folylpolyglutamate synthase